MDVWKVLVLFTFPFLGGLFFIISQKQNLPLKLLLSFSGAYLFSVTMLHLLPELYHSSQTHTGLFILLGFIWQVFLEHFSQGIEHGHLHHQHTYRLPLAMLISLSLHAFLEGIPIADRFSNKLVWGIALHHFPVAVALATSIAQSHISNNKNIAILLLFASMSPLGYIVGISLQGQMQTHLVAYFDIIMAVVIGMFLHISTTILFEASEHHKFAVKKLFAITLGLALALLSYFFDQH